MLYRQVIAYGPEIKKTVHHIKARKDRSHRNQP